MKVAVIHGRTARDYNNELNEILDLKDPSFKALHSQLWQEHAPDIKEEIKAFSSIDSKINELGKEAREAAYQRDRVLLAKDLANVGRLYQLVVKNQRASKMNKILHCKAQNTIGASIVSNWMQENCQFRCGKPGDLDFAVDKDWLVACNLS